jgi:hypothetical protein
MRIVVMLALRMQHDRVLTALSPTVSDPFVVGPREDDAQAGELVIVAGDGETGRVVDLRQAQPRHASRGDRTAKESSGLQPLHELPRLVVLTPPQALPPTILRRAIVFPANGLAMIVVSLPGGSLERESSIIESAVGGDFAGRRSGAGKPSST